MDFTGIIFIVMMLIISIFLFSFLPILTFFLYLNLKKKGKFLKILGMSFFSLSTLGMIALVIKIIVSPSGFGPDYETIELKQTIGGKLLCKSVYTADFHSWQYDIEYKYISEKGDTLDFGNGSYCGREWNKDEQLSRLDNWLILQTGLWHGSDRLIMKNIINNSTNIYDFDNQFIENDSLWKVQNIKSLIDYCCPETFIEKIDKDEILIRYKFRTNKHLTMIYGKRIIKYRIDGITGNIKMISIE